MTPDSGFVAWLDAFFDAYFRRRPVNATFIGMHAYDEALPDLSERGRADTLADAEDLLRRLRLLPVEPLDTWQTIDRQLAEGFLLIQRWESSSVHFGLSNPSLWTGEAIFGLIGLLLQGREDTAVARLRAVPAFLNVGLAPAPAAWIARARRECTAAGLLLRDVAEAFPALRGSAGVASEAFARFDAQLAQLRATEDYACGADAFDLLLRHGHMLDMDADGLERLALARIDEERRAVAERSEPPGDSASDAPYLIRFETLWNAARDLAHQRDLLTFPDWPVRYVERPVWAQAAAPYLYFLPYRSPAPLDDTPVVEYLVPPGADDSTIKLNHVVHHGSLGHHVQNWFAARSKSRIGRIAAVDCASRIAMLCGGTLAEGWACYATDLAEEAGFLTPAESYAQQRAHIRMAARAVVDVRLHRRRFSLAEAIRYYVETVGMSPSAAESEAVKNSLFPGAACMYLAGWEGIWRLRRQFAGRSLRAFHDRLLAFGSVPVSLVGRALLSEEDSADVSDASSRVPALGGNGR